MFYFNYYIVFPEGDIQEISHPLSIGDIVDINGNVYGEDELKLSPKEIAYQVTGKSEKNHFKEYFIHYKLDMLNADEIKEEIIYRTLEEKRRKEKLNKVYGNLEKKLLNKNNKRKGFFI